MPDFNSEMSIRANREDLSVRPSHTLVGILSSVLTLLVVAGAFTSFAPIVEGQTSGSPTALLVVPNKAAYSPGENVDLSIWIHNGGDAPIAFPEAINWRIDFHRADASAVEVRGQLIEDPLEDYTTSNGYCTQPEEQQYTCALGSIESVDLSPSLSYVGGGDMPGQDWVVPSGASCKLYDDAPGDGWDQTIENATQAPSGTYVIAASVTNPQGGYFQGFQVIALSAASAPMIQPDDFPPADQSCFFRDTIEGFVAMATGGSSGYEFINGQMWKTGSTSPICWYYNPQWETWEGTTAEIISDIDNAFGIWENDGGSYVNFSYCGLQSRVVKDRDDGYSMVGWVDTPYTAEANCKAKGGFNFDCYIGFNKWKPENWVVNGHGTGTNLRNIAMHEAGHWLELGDLYGSVHVGLAMHGNMATTTLGWGDRSGVRYIYPETYTGFTGLVETDSEGMDAAATDIDGNGRPDLLVAWIGNPKDSCENNMRYRIGWNLDSLGHPTGWSDIRTLVPTGSVGCSTDALGITFANIDSDSVRDLLVAWVDDPDGANEIRWRVYWDIGTTGNFAGSTGTQFIKNGIGSYTSGLGVCVISNFGDPARKEFIFMWVDDPSYGNNVRSIMGYEASQTTGIPSAWTPVRQVNAGAWVGSHTDGASLGCMNIDESGGSDFIFAWIDDPDGKNKIHYWVGLNPNEHGETNTWIKKRGPGLDRNDKLGSNHQGLGIALPELDGAGLREIMFVVNHNPIGDNSIKWRIEWNGRYTQHP